MSYLKKFFIKFIISLIILICFPIKTAAQNNQKFTPVLKEERIKFRERIDSTIERVLALPINDSTENDYRDAFWIAQVSLTHDARIKRVLSESISMYNSVSLGFKRALLEAVYTLYPSEFTEEIDALLRTEHEPKLFAMLCHYLSLNGGDKKRMLGLLFSRFPDRTNDPILQSLELFLTERRQIALPPLKDLLLTDLYKDRLVIYSIQRPDRNYPGLAVVRLPNSKFLLNDNGNLFYIKQLARSISNLPGYITNGNTPAGILSIQGTAVSSSTFIGPTPNIQTILPFEDSTYKFMHDSAYVGIDFNENIYNSLLPDNWKNNPMILEAYRAGKAGRNEIIAHGTTIDPSFYSGTTYFPCTPSLGCLCAPEIWSEQTGELVMSEQMRLMEAIKGYDLSKGLLIVAETEDIKSPVSIEEIEKLIIR